MSASASASNICGLTFNNIDEARDILVRYTVTRGLSYRVQSSDRKQKYIVIWSSQGMQNLPPDKHSKVRDGANHRFKPAYLSTRHSRRVETGELGKVPSIKGTKEPITKIAP
jgi:hypothetical protein